MVFRYFSNTNATVIIRIELGFDMNIGRLDDSVHPFTGGAGPTDVRMTTRYKEEDIIEGNSCNVLRVRDFSESI